LTRTHSDGWLDDELISWWNEAIAAGKARDLVPADLPEPTFMREVHGRLSKSINPIIEQLFAEGLRDFLMTHITSADQTGYRVHAYRLGSPRGWLSEEQESAYHLVNLTDLRSGVLTRSHIIDSVDWFADKAPKTAAAIEPLRTIRDRMAETWVAWGGEEGGKGNQRHAQLRDAAARALRRMGGR